MQVTQVPRTLGWVLGLGLVCTIALFTGRHDAAEAQVPVVEGKGRVLEYFHRSRWVNSRAFGSDLYTVPEGRRLFITDIVVGNDGGETEWVDVYRKVDEATVEDDVLFPVPSKDCTALHLLSGMVFDTGETLMVVVRPGSGGTPSVQFNLRGYTVKVPRRLSALARFPTFDSDSDDTGFDESRVER